MVAFVKLLICLSHQAVDFLRAEIHVIFLAVSLPNTKPGDREFGQWLPLCSRLIVPLPVLTASVAPALLRVPPVCSLEFLPMATVPPVLGLERCPQLFTWLVLPAPWAFTTISPFSVATRAGTWWWFLLLFGFLVVYFWRCSTILTAVPVAPSNYLLSE